MSRLYVILIIAIIASQCGCIVHIERLNDTISEEKTFDVKIRIDTTKYTVDGITRVNPGIARIVSIHSQENSKYLKFASKFTLPMDLIEVVTPRDYKIDLERKAKLLLNKISLEGSYSTNYPVSGEIDIYENCIYTPQNNETVTFERPCNLLSKIIVNNMPFEMAYNNASWGIEKMDHVWMWNETNLLNFEQTNIYLNKAYWISISFAQINNPLDNLEYSPRVWTFSKCTENKDEHTTELAILDTENLLGHNKLKLQEWIHVNELDLASRPPERCNQLALDSLFKISLPVVSTIVISAPQSQNIPYDTPTNEDLGIAYYFDRSMSRIIMASVAAVISTIIIIAVIVAKRKRKALMLKQLNDSKWEKPGGASFYDIGIDETRYTDTSMVTITPLDGNNVDNQMTEEFERKKIEEMRKERLGDDPMSIPRYIKMASVDGSGDEGVELNTIVNIYGTPVGFTESRKKSKKRRENLLEKSMKIETQRGYNGIIISTTIESDDDVKVVLHD